MAKEEFDHNAGALGIDGQLYRLAKINRNGDRELFHIVKTKNGELVLHPVEIGIRCGMTPRFWEEVHFAMRDMDIIVPDKMSEVEKKQYKKIMKHFEGGLANLKDL